MPASECVCVFRESFRMIFPFGGAKALESSISRTCRFMNNRPQNEPRESGRSKAHIRSSFVLTGEMKRKRSSDLIWGQKPADKCSFLTSKLTIIRDEISQSSNSQHRTHPNAYPAEKLIGRNIKSSFIRCTWMVFVPNQAGGIRIK